MLYLFLVSVSFSIEFGSEIFTNRERPVLLFSGINENEERRDPFYTRHGEDLTKKKYKVLAFARAKWLSSLELTGRRKGKVWGSNLQNSF